MKVTYIIALLVLILSISGCSRTHASSQILHCPGTYMLNGAVGVPVSTDEQAFNILKEGKVYDAKNNTVWVEDQIPSDMTVNEALQKGLLKTNQNIMLESGNGVNNVWMLAAKDKAVDKQGNIYLCTYR